MAQKVAVLTAAATITLSGLAVSEAAPAAASSKPSNYGVLRQLRSIVDWWLFALNWGA